MSMLLFSGTGFHPVIPDKERKQHRLEACTTSATRPTVQYPTAPGR
jgi:hypothetical protein